MGKPLSDLGRAGLELFTLLCNRAAGDFALFVMRVASGAAEPYVSVSLGSPHDPKSGRHGIGASFEQAWLTCDGRDQPLTVGGRLKRQAAAAPGLDLTGDREQAAFELLTLLSDPDTGDFVLGVIRDGRGAAEPQITITVASPHQPESMWLGVGASFEQAWFTRARLGEPLAAG